jgi:hypothetical protein
LACSHQLQFLRMGAAVAQAEDTLVSAAAPILVEQVAATVDLKPVAQLAAILRGLIHPADMAVTDKGITHHEAQLENKFTVKVGPLPDSLLGRQAIRGATSSHHINPKPALPIVEISSGPPP